MSTCRLGRRPVDLLHEVADLHAYVERELHGVAVAVSDLDGFFFAASQSPKNEKNTRESDQAAERALAGRRLHSILSRGRKRILSAFARQRTLLWEFARVGNPATGAETTTAAPAAAEGERPQRDRKKERTANGTNSSLQVRPHHHHHQQQQEQQQQPNGATAAAAAADDDNNNNNDGNDDDSINDDDDWKRHTLVGMHRLLSRKASEPTATATAKATICRDMTKIAAALRQLGVQTTAAAAAAAAAAPLASSGDVPGPRPSSKTHPLTGTSPFAPPVDNLSPQRVQNTLRREGEGQRCDGRTTTSSSSGNERAAHRQSEGVDGGSDSGSHPLSSSSSSSSSSKSSGDALLLLHQQLRNSDGIDALLRRISEGVRPSSQNPLPPAASPAAIPERLCAKPSNNGGPAARAVAMPPIVASEGTGREARQRSTCSDGIGMGTRQGSTCGLSTPGCSNPRVGVGVARDGEREVRCTGQDVTGSVGGLGGGGGGGVGGTAGKERREKMLSPVGLSGAFCGVPEEGGEVSQRQGGGLRRIQRKEAFGGGGKDGIASNALINCKEAAGGRGKDGSPNDLIERKEADRGGGKGDSHNDLIECEEVVRGGGGGSSPNALIEREEVVGGGGVDGSPNALNLSSNRGSLKPGLSCSNVIAVAGPSKSCLRSSGQGGNGSDDKENRRVGVMPTVEAP